MAEEPLQSIVVVSDDNRRFKMVMRGSLDNLSVEKIKRYLAKSTGIEPDEQVLTHNDRLLANDMVGGDFGLLADDVLRMRKRTAEPAAVSSRAHVGTSATAYSDPAMMDADPSMASALRRDDLGRQRQLEEQVRASRTQPSQHVDASHLLATTPRQGIRPQGMSAPYGASPPTGSGGTPRLTKSSAIDSALSRRQDGYPAPPAASGSDPEHPLMTKLHALETENRALRQQMDKMKKDEAHKAFLQPGPQLTVVSNANANLAELSKELGVHLAFDDNLSCVVGFDESNTIILTVDPPTERLYMYSTLATTIPDDPVLRLRVYESVLEWALLGRDMAGGGVGVCTRSGILMMSTSVDLRHCNATALKDTAPVFVENLSRWRAAVAAIEPPAGAAGTRYAYD
jgi:hypothetical protein